MVHTGVQIPEFPPIYVLNLDERKDRWMEIQASFQKAGWPSIQRLSAVKATPGWKGCNASHQKALRLAIEHTYPWVLVLEDDCQPTMDSLERFLTLLPTLWKTRDTWDVFLGGCTTPKPSSVLCYNPPLLRGKGYTTHFCLYNQPSYTKLLEGIQTSPYVIDGYFMEDPTVRVVYTVPHLAIQASGKSDLQGGVMNYDKEFTDSNTQLREYLRDSSLQQLWILIPMNVLFLGMIYFLLPPT